MSFFLQEPASHLAGCGCPKCSKKTDRKMSQEAFIARARKVHGDKEIMGSVLVIIFQFLNNSKRNARQPGQLSDSCPKGKSVT